MWPNGYRMALGGYLRNGGILREEGSRGIDRSLGTGEENLAVFSLLSLMDNLGTKC